MIKIVAIGGSVRPGNFTSRAMALAVDELARQASVEVVDPAAFDLQPPGLGVNKKLQELVSGATAVLLATPEYHGSYSSVIKLVIENLGFPSVLAAKPVALLGVAAGQIGAIKALEHLRSVCSHVGALVLPSVVSIANVQKVFDAEGKCLDPAIEKRIRGLATSLLDYIRGAVCPKMILEEMVRK